jgi:multidrug efflux pump subunit AcrB
VGFTIVSMTLSLVAVFIPILFLGGIMGRLFREFAATIMVAILLSGAVSLSLTPMMCSRFLAPERKDRHGRFFDAFESFWERTVRLYARTWTGSFTGRCSSSLPRLWWYGVLVWFHIKGVHSAGHSFSPCPPRVRRPPSGDGQSQEAVAAVVGADTTFRPSINRRWDGWRQTGAACLSG